MSNDFAKTLPGLPRRVDRSLISPWIPLGVFERVL